MNSELKEILNLFEGKNHGKYVLKPRYSNECLTLTALANYALNKEKNASKENFEEISLHEICKLLMQEVVELSVEVDLIPPDEEKILEELADCAACITGMYAKVTSFKRENKI